ncbi:hypothetical protein QBC47DRAFT_417185 [Echria macrotheca]|uniref:Uncharacterized protein n=1 Tax=Echria macrotheca TaxID=438768 RepID=A0AAJ0F7K5_9PEZI|nr:hypothetical protein QBC47DRAFT_417185 [Echria macrotheca]
MAAGLKPSPLEADGVEHLVRITISFLVTFISLRLIPRAVHRLARFLLAAFLVSKYLVSRLPDHPETFTPVAPQYLPEYPSEFPTEYPAEYLTEYPIEYPTEFPSEYPNVVTTQDIVPYQSSWRPVVMDFTDDILKPFEDSVQQTQNILFNTYGPLLKSGNVHRNIINKFTLSVYEVHKMLPPGGMHPNPPPDAPAEFSKVLKWIADLDTWLADFEAVRWGLRDSPFVPPGAEATVLALGYIYSFNGVLGSLQYEGILHETDFNSTHIAAGRVARGVLDAPNSPWLWVETFRDDQITPLVQQLEASDKIYTSMLLPVVASCISQINKTREAAKNGEQLDAPCQNKEWLKKTSPRFIEAATQMSQRHKQFIKFLGEVQDVDSQLGWARSSLDEVLSHLKNIQEEYEISREEYEHQTPWYGRLWVRIDIEELHRGFWYMKLGTAKAARRAYFRLRYLNDPAALRRYTQGIDAPGPDWVSRRRSSKSGWDRWAPRRPWWI